MRPVQDQAILDSLVSWDRDDRSFPLLNRPLRAKVRGWHLCPVRLW